MQKLLKELSTQGVTLNIVEIGCGMPFANALMLLDGSSAVVKTAYSPYSKESQALFQIGEEERSISRTAAMSFAQNTGASQASHTISCTMQAGPGKIAHGYICLKNNNIDSLLTYHFTLGFSLTKAQASGEVRELMKAIIFRDICSVPWERLMVTHYKHIDGIFLRNGQFVPEYMPPEFKPFIFTSNGQWKRVAEHFRKFNDVAIIKGSFNPIHDGHRQLIQQAHKVKVNVLMSLTKSTVEGKEASLKELCDRARATGYTSIIDSSCKLYTNLLRSITRNTNPVEGRTYHLPMGQDVYERLDPKSELSDYNCHFYVFNRNLIDKCENHEIEFIESDYPDVSSSKIRAQALEEKVDTYKKICESGE